MSLFFLITIIVVIAILAIVALFFVLRGGSSSSVAKSHQDEVTDDVEHIFNDSFREELRNRGRLQFEKILDENAMFLQQDLRVTTSQLNDFIKDEVKKILVKEFKDYSSALDEAKDLTIKSFEDAQSSVERVSREFYSRLSSELEDEKKARLARFDHNMEDIVNHYVLEAIGDQISMDQQIEFIMAQLERNRASIHKDIMADMERPPSPEQSDISEKIEAIPTEGHPESHSASKVSMRQGVSGRGLESPSPSKRSGFKLSKVKRITDGRS